ncbi:disulfide bond formation protein DsbA [Campylobacter sp. MIT 99-7217]|uniref:thiol:disulfide interchange protein DsbA/DsbL n=1 Tax=Campylobacter sp. MIT 99-7217 TaxID=535091 RepID=UPI001158A7DD|nr:thiol:disulfide interchange protein DsbA/DsbL [Campylobacter sp. MIT 99-7217]TQR34586.1 disulfide bond formation protein DsbA [Campylobacter sp. MIT 99-7217]
MKALKALFLTLFIYSCAFSLDEGKDYLVLQQPFSNAQNSVTEVFSYGCIHCFNQHKQNTLALLKQKLPNLSYKAYPVKQMASYGNEFANLYAYASYKDSQSNLDVTDSKSLMHKINDAYFTAYFERRMTWNDGKNPKAFYELGLKILGIDYNTLQNFLVSKEGKEILSSFDKALEPAKNTGTPAFIVNGKYQVLLNNITSLEQFIKVIEELSKK